MADSDIIVSLHLVIGTACFVCYFHAETPSGFLGNLSGKTKQSVMFEIKFVSRFLVFLLQNVM